MSEEVQLDLLSGVVCPSCNGSGKESRDIMFLGKPMPVVHTCGECKGRGTVPHGRENTILDSGLRN